MCCSDLVGVDSTTLVFLSCDDFLFYFIQFMLVYLKIKNLLELV